MDEAIGNEVADPVDGTRIRNKENEFSLKPASSNMLRSNEMVTPGVDDYHHNSKHQHSDMLDAKDQDRIVSSEHASASPRCMDDAGVMVEELTLRNNDVENMIIVGTSNNRDRMSTRQNQWHNLFRSVGGSGFSSLHGPTGCKGKSEATSSACEDGGDNIFTGLLDEHQPLRNYNRNSIDENGLSNDDKGTLDDNSYPSGGIRTKILSKSGFSEFFTKSTLRDKGVIHESQARSTNFVAPLGWNGKPVSPLLDGVSDPSNTFSSRSICDGFSLRDLVSCSF